MKSRELKRVSVVILLNGKVVDHARASHFGRGLAPVLTVLDFKLSHIINNHLSQKSQDIRRSQFSHWPQWISWVAACSIVTPSAQSPSTTQHPRSSALSSATTTTQSPLSPKTLKHAAHPTTQPNTRPVTAATTTGAAPQPMKPKAPILRPRK